MLAAAPPPGGGWRDAPLLQAVTAHRDAGHSGQAIGCADEKCRQRVDYALAAAFAGLPPARGPGRMFPG